LDTNLDQLEGGIKIVHGLVIAQEIFIMENYGKSSLFIKLLILKAIGSIRCQISFRKTSKGGSEKVEDL